MFYSLLVPFSIWQRSTKGGRLSLTVVLRLYLVSKNIHYLSVDLFFRHFPATEKLSPFPHQIIHVFTTELLLLYSTRDLLHFFCSLMSFVIHIFRKDSLRVVITPRSTRQLHLVPVINSSSHQRTRRRDWQGNK